jgi:serine/threonine protein kinase
LQLGRYQVLKHLASGGIADVLLARASGLEGFARHVVIKRMKPELAKEERFAKAFLDEARISASLNHQNIVQVHDIGEEGGSYFFAMEYIHGEDTRTLLNKVRERGEHVPLEIAVAIMMSAAAGLHHAHEKTNSQGEKLGIVHRDVSPSNILVGYDGSVKIVDFGLAKAAQRSTTTASGTLKGKASYMSPEQCKGEPVDRRTDTFCLGIVLYELVTAQRLFKGPTEYATMAAVVDGEIPPPSRLRADIPPALDAIILRALSRKAADRYQTAEDFRAAVEAFAVEYQLRTSNKALADYLTRLFGQRPEPWHAGVDLRPVTDETLGSARGAAVPPPIMPAKPAPKPAPPPVEEDEPGEDEFSDDEVKTTLMADDSKLAIEAEARIAEAKAKKLREEAEDAAEEFSRTVVEPPAFDSEAETDIETPGAKAAAADLQKPLGKKVLNRQQADTVPNQTRAPSPPAGAGSQPPSVKSGKTPPGAFQPHVPSGKTPPGAFQPVPAPAKTGNTPPGAFPNQARRDPTYPVVQGGVYPGQSAPNPAVRGDPSYGSPSVFSQYTPASEDISLSKLAGLKQWFTLYRRSIFLGGGMGVGVVIIMVIIMRACGDSPPPVAPDAMPIDANEIKMSAPVDAATSPPDAAKVHKPRKGSGSAAR